MAGGDVVTGPVGELRAASAAGGGTALSTTAALIQLPLGTHHVFIAARNFSTAVVAKVAFNPWLWVLKTADGLDTSPMDYSEPAQDASAATDVDVSSLNTAANRHYLFAGSHLPFRGVSVDVDQANGNAATLAVEYWNGQAWASISATDGTASGGATLAVDGTVTWTVPAAWRPESLQRVVATITPAAFPGKTERLYWTRWSVSAQLDSTTTVNSMVAMSRSTAYSEWLPGQAFEERVHFGPGGVGCIEALTDAGTANLIVNVAAPKGGRFK